MARVLYLDAFSGISGDMLLGAFLDAGLPLDDLRTALGSVLLPGYSVDAVPVLRAGVAATHFVVSGETVAHDHGHDEPHGFATSDGRLHEHTHSHTGPDGTVHVHSHSHAAGHHHRTLPEIHALIEGSALSSVGKQRARSMFDRLADAEARIHRMPVEEVHLHEVGAIDSIIDIVGGVFAMEWAGVDRVVCSPLNVGGGMVRSEHGLFPVPAPATLALLGSAPVYSGAVQKELVTPTGALLATTYASSFGPLPAMSIERIGYGAGTRDNPGTPNVLRIVIGQEAHRPVSDRVVVIECEIDDMNPQLFGAAMERLYAAGALEVFYVPVQMKKNRPGTLLTVIAPPDLQAAMVDVVFQETSTIGLRYHEVARECLPRAIITVETPLGPVRFKEAFRAGRVVNATPEYEDCVALARSHSLPVKEVQGIALQAYATRASAPPTAL
ncbi:MAG: nickel pincer cofactor biosynthesis protein LarC [Acidobacteria bacterium]|nr:nickel pincer cofactor biosynthesis protein LarC [Acidobacteriota bacterium]